MIVMFQNVTPEELQRATEGIKGMTMTPERRAEYAQRFREKHLLDAMESLGNAIESLTEEEENQPLWEQVGVAREMIRAKLQTFCKHTFAEACADNDFNPRCTKCWWKATVEGHAAHRRERPLVPIPPPVRVIRNEKVIKQ